MKRRNFLQSTLLAIPGVGWLANRSEAAIEPRLSDVKGRLIWSEWPRTVEFARVYARVASCWNDSQDAVAGENWVIRTALSISAQYETDFGYLRHAGRKPQPRDFFPSSVADRTLSVRFPRSPPIALISAEYGEYHWFHMMWHENEWWALWNSQVGREQSLELLKKYPEENKLFIDAFTEPNYVLIDPFSKTAHHQT